MTALLLEPAVTIVIQTATPATCGLTGKGSRHSQGLKAAVKPRGPPGWKPPAWRLQAASRPAPYVVVQAAPVVESAPAAPTLVVAAPVVVQASTSVELGDLEDAPAVVQVTPVVAPQTPAPAPASPTVSVPAIVPAALAAPVAVAPAPVVAIVAAQPCSMVVAVVVVPPAPVLRNMGSGMEVVAPVESRLALCWQSGSRWADILSGWSFAEEALAANLRLLTQGVDCLSLGQGDSEGDRWMAGTTVPTVDEVEDRRVLVRTEGRSKMEWESSPDSNAPSAMEIDGPSCTSMVLYNPLAAGVLRGEDGTVAVVPAGLGTYVSPERAFVSTVTTQLTVAQMAAANTAVVPMAAFAAGRVAGENRGRALFVSALPGVGVLSTGGAMLLALTTSAHVVPGGFAGAVGAVVGTSVACLPVSKASASADSLMAVITAGVRDLVLGDAISPMVSALSVRVQSGAEAILPTLTAVLAGLTLGDSGTAGSASSDAASVSISDGKRLPAQTGSTAVVNYSAGGGPSTPGVSAAVVQTRALPGLSSGSTDEVVMADVVATAASQSPSRKRKGCDLWPPIPDVAALARRGVYTPGFYKRRPFQQQLAAVSVATLPFLFVPVPLPLSAPPVILGLTAVFSALTIQSSAALADTTGTVGHLVRPMRTKRSRRRSSMGSECAAHRG